MKNEKFRQKYRKEITSVSFTELKELTRYLNKVFKYSPLVIGGWAVYYYTRGLGSLDIDLVMPSKQSIVTYIGNYCKTHGYKETSARFRANYKKIIQAENEVKTIDLDIFCFKDKNTLAENEQIEVPWVLGDKNFEEWCMEENVTARVPEKEVLLLYKVQALRGRTHKLRHALISEALRNRMQSKIWKDKQDIQNLLKLELNQEKLNHLLKETGFKELFEKTINELKGLKNGTKKGLKKEMKNGLKNGL